METLGTERVTAGLPSLSPSVRFERDQREVTAFTQRQRIDETDKKRDDAVAPDGERDRTDLRASIGKPLHSSRIIERLKRLNPNLDINHHPYLERFVIFHKETYLGAFEDNYSPQFDIFLWHWEEHVAGHGRDARLEKVKVLDDTTKGWTRLLVQLIHGKWITRAEAEREFGLVYSKTWREMIRDY